MIEHLRVRRLLKKSESLLKKGQVDEALSLLNAANQRQPDSRFERQLLRIRHEGFFSLTFPTPDGNWPPTVDDPLDGGPGIPEVDASDMSVKTARSAVFGRGSLIIRNLLTPEQVNRLTRGISHAFTSFDALQGHADGDEWFSRFSPHEGLDDLDGDRPFVRGGGGVLATESPRAFSILMDVFDKAGVFRMVTEFLGERPALSVRKTTLRDVPPTVDSDNGWHQDGAFLGRGIRALNVWVALSDCGEDSPSMDMVPRRLTEILPTGTEGAMFSWSVSPKVVESVLLHQPATHLTFRAGDAIIFDEMNLHRTSTLPGMTKNRMAIEAWFFAPSCYPLEQLPLLV